MKPCIPALIGLGLLAAPAAAHVTLAQQEAVAGAGYKAVLRVGHGCEGAATTEIRLRIPEGFVNAKPMPKPGWETQVVRGPYARPATLHGAEITEGAVEIIWSGGSLPDDFYDEFVVSGTLAADLPLDAPLYFPVVQACGEAAERWIEIPTPGQSGHDLDHPAPGLTLLPKP